MSEVAKEVREFAVKTDESDVTVNLLLSAKELKQTLMALAELTIKYRTAGSAADRASLARMHDQAAMVIKKTAGDDTHGSRP